MDGAPILTIEMAQNKAYTATALLGVSTQDFFNFIQGDPSLLAGIPMLSRVAASGGGFPIKVNGEVIGVIGSPWTADPSFIRRLTCKLGRGAFQAWSENKTTDFRCVVGGACCI
jgi:hypothetical protein